MSDADMEIVDKYVQGPRAPSVSAYFWKIDNKRQIYNSAITVKGVWIASRDPLGLSLLIGQETILLSGDKSTKSQSL